MWPNSVGAFVCVCDHAVVNWDTRNMSMCVCVCVCGPGIGPGIYYIA